MECGISNGKFVYLGLISVRLESGLDPNMGGEEADLPRDPKRPPDQYAPDSGHCSVRGQYIYVAWNRGYCSIGI
jgi:hypothetical protein